MPGYLRACFVSVGGNGGQGEARFHLTPPEILQPGLLTSAAGEEKRGGGAGSENLMRGFSTDRVKSLLYKYNFSQSPESYCPRMFPCSL